MNEIDSTLASIQARLETAPLRDRFRDGLTPSAVALPLLLDEQGRLAVLFTRRTDELRNHRGQIAFPGGRIDDTDASPAAAAIRELEEELGFPADGLRLLGRLSCYPTITDYLIAPFVVWLGECPQFDPNPSEVAEVFTVPLDDLLMGRVPYWSEEIEWEGRTGRVHFYDWGPHRIWGATAGILREFLGILTPKIEEPTHD